MKKDNNSANTAFCNESGKWNPAACNVSLQTRVVFFLKWPHQTPSEFSNSLRHYEDDKDPDWFQVPPGEGTAGELMLRSVLSLKKKKKRRGTVIKVLWSAGEGSFNTGHRETDHHCAPSLLTLPTSGQAPQSAPSTCIGCYWKERITTALCVQALQNQQYLKIICTSSLSALIKLLVNMSSGIYDQLHWIYEFAELTLLKPTQLYAAVA